MNRPKKPTDARLDGFRSAYVFDVSQTDGDPLPTLAHDMIGVQASISRRWSKRSPTRVWWSPAGRSWRRARLLTTRPYHNPRVAHAGPDRCVAPQDSHHETLANVSTTGRLRDVPDQKVAEIVQCGEPIFSIRRRRRPIRDLNNSDPTRSAATRAVPSSTWV